MWLSAEILISILLLANIGMAPIFIAFPFPGVFIFFILFKQECWGGGVSQLNICDLMNTVLPEDAPFLGAFCVLCVDVPWP